MTAIWLGSHVVNLAKNKSGLEIFSDHYILRISARTKTTEEFRILRRLPTLVIFAKGARSILKSYQKKRKGIK